MVGAVDTSVVAEEVPGPGAVDTSAVVERLPGPGEPQASSAFGAAGHSQYAELVVEAGTHKLAELPRPAIMETFFYPYTPQSVL